MPGLDFPPYKRSRKQHRPMYAHRPVANLHQVYLYSPCLPAAKLSFQHQHFHIQALQPVIMKYLFFIQLLSYVLLAHAA